MASARAHEPLRIAVVAMFGSHEAGKLALILRGIRDAGHIPVLIDAKLFSTGEARLTRNAGGRPAIALDNRMVAATIADNVTGEYRQLKGRRATLHVDGVEVVARTPMEAPVSPETTLHPYSAASSMIPIDAVVPEGIDILHRAWYQNLYKQIGEHDIPSNCGPDPWLAVQNTIHKDRTLRLLAEVADRTGYQIGLVKSRTVTKETTRDELRSIWEELSGPDGFIWVKASNDTHGQGVEPTLTFQEYLDAVDEILGNPAYNGKCLVQRDSRGLMARNGTVNRVDLNIAVVDGEAVHATLRYQRDLALPTNSKHGGKAIALDLDRLPQKLKDDAVWAITVTGNKSGSVDFVGSTEFADGSFDYDDFELVAPPSPLALNEVNMNPGGRSPGYFDRVVRPFVQSIVRAVARDRAGRDVSQSQGGGRISHAHGGGLDEGRHRADPVGFNDVDYQLPELARAHMRLPPPSLEL